MYIQKYYDEILENRITVGKYVRKLYARLTENIALEKYILCDKKAENAVKFIESYCRHSKGRNDLITLELWQKALIEAIFGLNEKDGVRVFREVIVIIGRKNGKSLLAAAIMAYSAFLESEYGAEIYCVAKTKKQAEIVFDVFSSMIQADEELKSLCRAKKGGLYIDETNTFIEPLPGTPKAFDGKNPNLIICDELAAWEGAHGIKQYEVLKSACGSRKQPLIINITTAGYESGGIFDELYKRGTDFLNGNLREKRLLPVFYTIDDQLLWDDLDEIEKANPNIGVSISREYFENEIAIAHGSPSKKAEILTKYCNIKQNSAFSWLPFEVIDSAGSSKTLEEFRGCYAVGGMDLSLSVDMTAACVIIEKDDCIHVFTRFFMPENKFKKDKTLYNVSEIFIEDGSLEISGENNVNYENVRDWFLYLRDELGIMIQCIGFDRYSARETVNELQKNGFKCEDVWQGWNLHPTIVEFEGLIKDGKIKLCSFKKQRDAAPNSACGRGILHENRGNELMKLHLSNVALEENSKSGGRYQMTKMSQYAKIDGAVALMDALTVRRKYWNQWQNILINE